MIFYWVFYLILLDFTLKFLNILTVGRLPRMLTQMFNNDVVLKLFSLFFLFFCVPYHNL